MPTSHAEKVGPYQIGELIGAGGMGEVYKALDTRLGRTVAIKVLLSELVDSPDSRQRFEREARAVSQLSHPNVCALFDIGDEDGRPFLVMELLEGETLAQRLSRGPLSLDQVFGHGGEICAALSHAHQHGIVHRDLKPGNIMLTRQGVKLLDFGLAQPVQPKLLNAETAATTAPLKAGDGTFAATLQYVSPEQVDGKPADERSDIFALGAVLYEMVSGKPAFSGKTGPATMAAVLMRSPPPASQGRANVPPALDRLIAACLVKEPEERVQSAHDVKVQLRWISEDAFGGAVFIPAWRRALPWLVAGAFALTAVVALWPRAQPLVAPTPRRLLADIGAQAALRTDFGASAILSPDGATLAFVAQEGSQTRLFIRKLDQLRASALLGTEDAASPFFSPDGQWLAFFAGGKLKKISVLGGAAVNLCDAPVGRGGAWFDDNTIVFTPTNGANTQFMSVSASGGTPKAFGALSEGAVTQRWPQALPGGKGVLYTEHTSTVAWDGANLVVSPSSGATSKIVVRGGYYGRFLPSGHLIYMQQGALFAIRFDLGRLETVGQPVPALEGVAANVTSGGAQLALSSDGTLVYVSGSAAAATNPIDWMTRDGKTLALRAARADWTTPRFSPDGTKLAFDIADGKQRDIWVYEWAKDSLTQVTFDPGEDRNPVWTPDGRRLAFSSDRANPDIRNLYWVNADGTGDVTRLTESGENQIAFSWHPSGAFLAFQTLREGTSWDLMVLPIQGNARQGFSPGAPTAFLATPASELWPMFSPDGRWIAYGSTEGGNFDIYVRPFLGPGGKWRVSAEGGSYPRWSAATRELLFLNPAQNKVMFAAYNVSGHSLRADKPQIWSPTSFVPLGSSPYDLHPDGKRLALASGGSQAPAEPRDKVVFFFNFGDYLNKVAPGKR
jgi:Tol biopolymer transport system component